MKPRAAVSKDPAHHRARAKNVILCYMSGGVSHIDSFDPKPMLEKMAGQPMPTKIERTVFNNNGNIYPALWDFHRYGEVWHAGEWTCSRTWVLWRMNWPSCDP